MTVLACGGAAVGSQREGAVVIDLAELLEHPPSLQMASMKRPGRRCRSRAGPGPSGSAGARNALRRAERRRSSSRAGRPPWSRHRAEGGLERPEKPLDLFRVSQIAVCR